MVELAFQFQHHFRRLQFRFETLHDVFPGGIVLQAVYVSWREWRANLPSQSDSL